MVLNHTSNLQFNKQIGMPLHMSKNIFYTNKNAQFSYGLIRAIPVETASNGKDCVCKKTFPNVMCNKYCQCCSGEHWQ